MINVLVVDDHTIVRDGLKAMLQLSDKHIQVIGEAGTGRALIDLLNTTVETGNPLPDVVLMDINMPEMDGLAATRHLRKHFPQIKVIILSMMEDEQFITEAFQAGAAGYLLKSVGYPELTHALEVVTEGGQYITAQITLNLLGKKPGHSALSKTATEPGTHLPPSVSVASTKVHLTRREIEVLRLIAQGYTNAEIADQLFTSKRTVENHRQSLLEKTGSKNTALLIRYALTHHLLD